MNVLYISIFAVVLVAGLAAYALVAVYMERKVAAFIQDRLGPMETGKFGWLQTLADIIKLLQKEVIVPTAADKWLFAIAPILIFVSVYLGFSLIPFNDELVGISSNLGVFFLLAIMAIEVLGILMAGWGSNNKYSLIGAIRSVAQMVSYEIPAGLALLSVVIVAQSLNMQVIAQEQGLKATQDIFFFGFYPVNEVGGFLAWNIFQAPHLILAFVIYFIASLAEANRAPFDLPEAESELVAGYHVEYGGFRFAAIMLAEYSMMLLVSMIAVTLFLGAYQSPLPNIGSLSLATSTSGPIWGIFWLLSKAMFMVFIQMWIRWTVPRLRVDRLMALAWKVLLPLSLLCVILSGLWLLWKM